MLWHDASRWADRVMVYFLLGEKRSESEKKGLPAIVGEAVCMPA